MFAGCETAVQWINTGASFGTDYNLYSDFTHSSASIMDLRPSARMWYPRVSDVGVWVQVDVGKPRIIHGLMLYKGIAPRADEWVTSFQVKLGLSANVSQSWYITQNR